MPQLRWSIETVGVMILMGKVAGFATNLARGEILDENSHR